MSSVRVVVPTRHRDSFQHFINMEAQALEALRQALLESEPALLVRDLVHRVSPSVDIDDSALRGIVTMLASLSRARASSGASATDYAFEVSRSAKSLGLGNSSTDWGLVCTVLGEVISARSVEVTAKALDVMGQHRELFCTSRVLSDLRPVFMDASADVAAFVIVHTLMLAYHNNRNYDKQDEHFIALDRADLEQLKSVIERALQKDDTLCEVAGRTGVPLLRIGNA